MFKIYNMSGADGSPAKMELDYEFFKFPGGEVHFKVEQPLILENGLHIKTDLSNSDEVMLMMLMADAYRHRDKYLELLYTPYARQDRRTSHGEPFSLRVMANLINSCGFKWVTVYDPHSDVTPALINNIYVIKRLQLVQEMGFIKNFNRNGVVIVSPDAGAMKANNDTAMYFNVPHVVATKVRDVTTGEISHTEVHTSIDLEDKHLFILDDICDGGRTFIELAKVLRERKPRSLTLYVTVGIFSKGLPVVQAHFDAVHYYHRHGV
jgi:ribose-phosphate pyrophosphokinase